MIEKNRLKILLPVVLLLTGIACAWAVIATRPQMTQQTPNTEAPLVTVIQVEP